MAVYVFFFGLITYIAFGNTNHCNYVKITTDMSVDEALYGETVMKPFNKCETSYDLQTKLISNMYTCNDDGALVLKKYINSDDCDGNMVDCNGCL